MITAFCFRDHVGGSWLRTKVADRFFLASSIGAVLFLLEYLALLMSNGLQHSLPTALEWTMLLFTAYTSVSWTAIYIGMIYYWLIHDRRRNWWALAIASFSLFSVFYYFFVYREETTLVSSSGGLDNRSPASI